MTTPRRTHRQEKLARIYDDEILPIWAQRFGRMLLRGLELPPKAMILDVGCGTGYPALEVVRKMDEQSRLIAIDSQSTMLDVARKKAGELGGKRIFFRTETAYPRLPFTEGVYDVVMCNLGLTDAPDPKAALKDFGRVTKPGGKVLATLPMAGTWDEFHDIYREVLVKHDKHDILERLEAHIQSYPTVEQAESWLNGAGLADATVEVEQLTLLFRSSREFFFAPVIEYGPLSKWKEIAGRGQELQDVFWYIKQAIDAYFKDRAFEVTVKAGCLRGTRVLTPELALEEEVETGKVDRVDLDDPSGEWLPVNTGDVQVLGEDDGDADSFADVELDAFREESGSKPKPK
jgi:ubiquinone/menaquinone biosynthesis C-methylase UbiE